MDETGNEVPPGTTGKLAVKGPAGCRYLADELLVKELQDFVKKTIAPFKYPRALDFVDSLQKTETGKIQRFKLRQV